MNPKLKISGLVLTMFDSQTKLSHEVVAELNRFIEEEQGQDLPWSGARVFGTKIRRNIKLAESPSFGQNILKYEPTSNGATDYRSLAKEVAAMTETAAGPVIARPPVKVNVATNLDPAKLAASHVGSTQNQEVA